MLGRCEVRGARKGLNDDERGCGMWLKEPDSRLPGLDRIRSPPARQNLSLPPSWSYKAAGEHAAVHTPEPSKTQGAASQTTPRSSPGTTSAFFIAVCSLLLRGSRERGRPDHQTQLGPSRFALGLSVTGRALNGDINPEQCDSVLPRGGDRGCQPGGRCAPQTPAVHSLARSRSSNQPHEDSTSSWIDWV